MAGVVAEEVANGGWLEGGDGGGGREREHLILFYFLFPKISFENCYHFRGN